MSSAALVGGNSVRATWPGTPRVSAAFQASSYVKVIHSFGQVYATSWSFDSGGIKFLFGTTLTPPITIYLLDGATGIDLVGGQVLIPDQHSVA